MQFYFQYLPTYFYGIKTWVFGNMGRRSRGIVSEEPTRVFLVIIGQYQQDAGLMILKIVTLMAVDWGKVVLIHALPLVQGTENLRFTSAPFIIQLSPGPKGPEALPTSKSIKRKNDGAF